MPNYVDDNIYQIVFFDVDYLHVLSEKHLNTLLSGKCPNIPSLEKHENSGIDYLSPIEYEQCAV